MVAMLTQVTVLLVLNNTDHSKFNHLHLMNQASSEVFQDLLESIGVYFVIYEQMEYEQYITVTQQANIQKSNFM